MVKRTCTSDGCKRPHAARGWCKMHYNRWRTGASPQRSGLASSYQKMPFPWLGTIDAREDGTVWRTISNGVPCQPKRIDLPDHSKGYRNVVLPDRDSGRWRTYKAHRLVWWSHKGDPGDLQVDHLNGDKSDNRIINLDLVDQSTNIRRSLDNGRVLSYTYATEWRGRPLITDNQKDTMRILRQQGVILREIAVAYGISTTHVHKLTTAGWGSSGEWQ